MKLHDKILKTDAAGKCFVFHITKKTEEMIKNKLILNLYDLRLQWSQNLSYLKSIKWKIQQVT